MSFAAARMSSLPSSESMMHTDLTARFRSTSDPAPTKLDDLLRAVAQLLTYVATQSARAPAGEQPISSPVEDRSETRPNSARRPRTKSA